MVRTKRPAVRTAGDPPPRSSRVWSLADEVRILEGLAAYMDKGNNKPPVRSELKKELNDYIRDKKEYTVTEIYEKVRSLRLRFFRLRDNGGVAGEDTDEDVRKYQLSTRIWGHLEAPETVQHKRVKKEDPEPKPVKKQDPEAKRVKKQDSEPAPEEEDAPHKEQAMEKRRRGLDEMRALYPLLYSELDGIATEYGGGMSGEVLKWSFGLVDDETALKMEAKVKKQRIEELKVEMSEVTIANKVLSLLLDGMD